MKIICLCKRKPQSRDLYTRPYGRFYFLPKELMVLGHHIEIVLMSYSINDEFVSDKDGIRWHSVNMLPNPYHYYSYVRTLAKKINADWIIGFSDIYYGLCAQKVAHEVGCKALIDAYDNYESYIPWLKPLHLFWRRALKKTDAITTAGPSLLKLMTRGIEDREERFSVIPMAADPIFKPGKKSLSRINLKLPINCLIIGYCGSISHTRGIELLLSAFQKLSNDYPEVHFLISGKSDINLNQYLTPNLTYIGYLSDEFMPDLINSLDLLVAVNKDNNFGNYSFPVKIYEALALNVPVVASRTESTQFVLKNYPENLVSPGSEVELVQKLKAFIDKPYAVSENTQRWAIQAKKLETLMLSVPDNNELS